MSGSQHNPNGRQSQLGSGWSPLQLQMASLLARSAPQAHMASDRGVTWHTPTPPPHLYHVPAPSPPDPLQAMKNAGSNSVFRHTATPPELFRHTPTPPDKHIMRHTPSPGDVKSGPPMPPVDLYPHMGPGRDKLVRTEELLAYARGVDLSLGSRANGAPPLAHSPALSVRDAPTINSLISRSGGRRVDSLLERLSAGGAPASPHSVIVHGRAMATPSPPSSNEDSGDSLGAAGGSKRKRKPERCVRVPPPLPPPPAPDTRSPSAPASPAAPPERVSAPAENGHPPPARSPPPAPAPPPPAPEPCVSPRRNTRSGSAETIAEIAAMIAGGGCATAETAPHPAPAPLSVDKLQSVLASPEPEERVSETEHTRAEEPSPTTPSESASPCPNRPDAPAPSRTRAAHSPAGAARSPSDARAADGAAAPAEPAAAFVEVENQLEKMFAGLEEEQPKAASDREEPSGSFGRKLACYYHGLSVRGTEPAAAFVEVENQLKNIFAGLEEKQPKAASDKEESSAKESAPPSKRRKSAPGRGREAPPRRKGPRKKPDNKGKAKESREGYDSGSNASSGRSRGPYIQIRGPRASPVSVCVMNATTGEEEEPAGRRRGAERRRGLHASTLGLRYDAATRDLTWLCAFCGRAPHAANLGDLFGPYTLDTDLPEYRALDDATQRKFVSEGSRHEAWLHADCAVWAPGVVAAGARVWGLPRAVWAAAAERCKHCVKPGAPVACAARNCNSRAHLPCARVASWKLEEEDFRALCPTHRN